MRRTFAYFISILALIGTGKSNAQDTVDFPLKIRAGFDISGPIIHFSDKSNFDLEGYLSADRNEKMAYALEGGYLRYKYSQYNYSYQSSGIFLRAGADFNLLKPETSKGRHWAGVGLRYGVSVFTSETPSLEVKNYWGSYLTSVPRRTSMGHFLEVDPGVRTELFKNLSIGWTIRLRLLVSGGGGKDLRPIYFPGFGNSGKTVNTGMNYYIVWSIPYKTKRVITIPEVQEEETEEEPTQTPQPNQSNQDFFRNP